MTLLIIWLLETHNLVAQSYMLMCMKNLKSFANLR